MFLRMQFRKFLKMRSDAQLRDYLLFIDTNQVSPIIHVSSCASVEPDGQRIPVIY